MKREPFFAFHLCNAGAHKYWKLHVARPLIAKLFGVAQAGSPPPGPCAALFLFVAACSRTPAEPAPAANAPLPVLSTGAPLLTTRLAPGPPHAPPPRAGRCVRETPAEPPPAASAAKVCPRDPGPRPMLARAKVAFETGEAVAVEIARTEDETARGLMYRTSMPEGEGMIFAMDRREHVFWMHDTCIPLDMLFIDEDGTIVGIEESVPVLNDASRGVGCESTHVLEVNAGWCRRHGIKAGMKVKPPLP